MVPYTSLIGDIIYPIVWGTILLGMLLTNKNPMMVAVIGLIISSFLIAGNVITSSTASAFLEKAYLLVGLAIGLALFVLIRSKVNRPGDA